MKLGNGHGRVEIELHEEEFTFSRPGGVDWFVVESNGFSIFVVEREKSKGIDPYH